MVLLYYSLLQNFGMFGMYNGAEATSSSRVIWNIDAFSFAQI
jgi:hypothetical protein